MDFRQIEAFLQVVKHKSFSKAADSVFLTQPTISAHISSLESELGIKLIDRSGKEILPTKAGKIFCDYANNLINLRDNAIYNLNEFNCKVEGRLEVSASTVPAQYMLPKIMKGFYSMYPNVSFSIEQLDSGQVIDALLEKRIELGIVGTKSENSKLEFEKVTDDKMVLIVPSNRRFSNIQSDTIPLEFIKNEHFIFRESGSGTRQEFEKILQKSSIPVKSINVIAQMNSSEAIKQAVSIGLGVSIVSLISVLDYLKFGILKAYDIEGLDLSRSFYLAHLKNRPLSPLSIVFMDYIRQYYKELQPELLPSR